MRILLQSRATLFSVPGGDTIQILKTLKQKVTAVGFYRSEQPGKRLAEDLFKQYSRYAGDRTVTR